MRAYTTDEDLCMKVSSWSYIFLICPQDLPRTDRVPNVVSEACVLTSAGDLTFVPLPLQHATIQASTARICSVTFALS